MQDLITAAVINFQTPDLLETAVRSFSQFYPDLSLLIIDNGSRDDSVQRIRQLESEFSPRITVLLNDENRFHGPAMNQIMQSIKTPFAYIFDSDTKTFAGGFLENLVGLLIEGQRNFAAGERVTVNKRGFVANGGIPVPVSAYMLIQREMYLQLAPFEHHGLPVLACCTDAARRGWRVAPYRMEAYVEHIGRGTAREFGYSLGWKSRINYLLNRLGF